MGGGRAGRLHPLGRSQRTRSCTAATPASPRGHRWRQDVGVPVCQGHQIPPWWAVHLLARGPAPPPRLCAGFYLPLGKSSVRGRIRIALCYRLPFPPPPKINPPKAIAPSDERPSAHRAPKSPQMHGAGSPRACIFPAGPCLGCSWLRRAASCRCDLFICLHHHPPPPPKRCLPLAFLPHCRASPPSSSHPAHRGGETRSPPCADSGISPVQRWRRAGIAGAGVCVRACVGGGVVNLILRGWKRKKIKTIKKAAASSFSLSPAPED